MEERTAESLFSEYVAIIHRLRRECPWDREQTHESLRTPLLEETYEVLDAIADRKPDPLCNELGDLFLHIAMQAEIATEERSFTIADVLARSMEKLVRRHPHVFGGPTAGDSDSVRKNWEAIKRQEGKSSILDGVPEELPALIRAQRTQEKASVLGFDWKEKSEVWKKVEEEFEEFRRAEETGTKALVEEEFGDMLFALVNYSRFINTSAEFALRKSVDKFGRRFQYIEDTLKQRGRSPGESTLEEMDLLWNEAKRTITS